MSRIDVRTTLIRLIGLYLSSRELENSHSSRHLIAAVVPVWVRSSFHFYERLTAHTAVKIAMYADDTVLYTCRSDDIVYSRLKRADDKAGEWASKWRLRMNEKHLHPTISSTLVAHALLEQHYPISWSNIGQEVCHPPAYD